MVKTPVKWVEMKAGTGAWAYRMKYPTCTVE